MVNQITSQSQIYLTQKAQQTIIHDVCDRATIEACGVLLGKQDQQGNWHVTQAHPLNNIFHSSVYFEFAPEELLMIELNYPGQVIGVYHSHPGGYDHASSTDEENMRRVNLEQAIPWAWLIILGPFDTAFIQYAQKTLPSSSVLAYHYFEQSGLKQLAVHLERD